MTQTPDPSPLRVSRDADIVRIALNRPARGNALTPELLTAFCAALEDAQDARAVVVTGEGRAFSSGGDIREFHSRADNVDALERFGDAIVSSLNRAILALRALPCPTVAAVNGPVTGGAIGLMLACDITLMCRDAFIQPYYARMGFAPDGGWTALLPERIGTARTASWLALDTRVSAVAAFEMGLADRLADARNFTAELDSILATLALHDPAVTATSRRLLDARRGPEALADCLDRERAAFRQLLVRPETRSRMAAFLAPREAVG